jgi:hypothetical protein
LPAAAAPPTAAVELPSASTSTVCPGTGNPVGVGKPCRTAADCRGQTAITCPRATDPAGFDFCTRACTGTERDECGEGAVCVPQGKRPSVCVPVACSRQLAEELPLDTTVIADCQAPANAAGVGKPCASHADCAGNAVARFCPKAVDPGKAGWCSMLCQDDRDCGDGGFCWRRRVREHGETFQVASCALAACKAPLAATPTEGWEDEEEQQEAAKTPAGNANVGRTCAPGQVNDKGVGKPCQTREDCAGLWANFCDIVVNKRRPPMCSRMCDDDTDCGPGAYCGVINGVRHCYPNQCSDWKWTPGCDKWNPFCHDIRAEEPKPGDEVKHAGAVVCAGGIAYSDEGYGLRCDKSSHNLHGETCKGKRAQSCQATFNPDGPDFCERECWAESTCGNYGYCGWQWPLKSFSVCWPRCPEPEHRAVTAQPAQLDLCLAEGGVVPKGNAAGVGVRCQSSKDCAGNSGAKTCGRELTDVTRKPDVCTMACQSDADCGRNAVCSDVDFNLGGDGKPSGHRRYCVPACWAK